MSARVLELRAAPTGFQPGGYVPRVYGERAALPPLRAELDAGPAAGGYAIELRWPCPQPVREVAGETHRFADAAAWLAPQHPEAPWLTMGADGQAVAGGLWRADGDRLWAVRAAGLGTMQRSDAPVTWTVAAAWDAGRWQVRWTLPAPPPGSEHGLGVAVWLGADAERGGLKRTTVGWVAPL